MYADEAGNAVAWLICVLVLRAGLAFIPASIASAKGRDFALWYVYGLFLFSVALIHSLVAKRGVPALKVSEVTVGGFGEQVGIQRGDVIVSVDERSVATADLFRAIMERSGNRSIVVYRHGRYFTFTARGPTLGVVLVTTYVDSAVVEPLTVVDGQVAPQCVAHPPSRALGGGTPKGMQPVSKESSKERYYVGADPYEELVKLKGLFDNGILTEGEYEEKRKAILKRIG